LKIALGLAPDQKAVAHSSLRTSSRALSQGSTSAGQSSCC
jgi:hypothetical protein